MFTLDACRLGPLLLLHSLSQIGIVFSLCNALNLELFLILLDLCVIGSFSPLQSYAQLESSVLPLDSAMSGFPSLLKGLAASGALPLAFNVVRLGSATFVLDGVSSGSSLFLRAPA